MRSQLVSAALLLCVSAVQHLPAQTPAPSAEDAFRASLLHGTVYPRDFNAAPLIIWHGPIDALTQDPPVAHQPSGIAVDKVEFTDTAILISGGRRILAQAGNQLKYIDPQERVTVEIDLPRAARESLKPALALQIFYRSVNDALNAYAALSEKSSGVLKAGGPCPLSSSRVKPPKVEHTVEPDFRSNRNGPRTAIEVRLTVGIDGKPRDIWSFTPGVNGTAWAALSAVSRYEFKPATCDKVPVASELHIDVIDGK